MTVRGRDAWDDLITTDERWISIPFGSYSPGADWKTVNDAEDWAKSEFGNGFFRLGNKFFFADEMLLVQFKLRWL